MPQREHAQRHDAVRDHVDDEPVAQVERSSAALDADVDAILDEIDTVLEENAEDFVKSFVQKGGQ